MSNNTLTNTRSIDGMPFVSQLLTLYYRQGWRGFSRLWGILKSMGHNPCLQASNKYGVRFYMNPNNYIDSHVLRSGYYESEVLEAILPFLDTGSVFWDIGANFGLHAITAKFLKPQSKVICIEPSPLMLAQLYANCRLNALEIEMVNVALSDSPRFQTLHLVEGNPGMSTLKPWEKAQYNSKVTCWCDSGDNLVLTHLLPQPRVIKIDVEGSELEVLIGLKNILMNSALKAVIFEENVQFLSQENNKIYEILVKAGFEIKCLNRQEKTQHNLGNFIAIRD
jgi:FkbM family methyltransferase